jgi:hypothetical protein
METITRRDLSKKLNRRASYKGRGRKLAKNIPLSFLTRVLTAMTEELDFVFEYLYVQEAPTSVKKSRVDNHKPIPMVWVPMIQRIVDSVDEDYSQRRVTQWVRDNKFFVVEGETERETMDATVIVGCEVLPGEPVIPLLSASLCE